MELKSDLSNVKEGDWVLDLQKGWAEVTCVRKYEIDTGAISFLKDGRRYESDKHPICFPADQVPEEFLKIYGPPPCPFKRGDIVKVWDDTSPIMIMVFKEYNSHSYRPYVVYNCIGQDTGISMIQEWSHCEKWEVPEE